MNTYKTKPYKLYRKTDGSVVHFDIEGLTLTGLEPEHIEVLKRFEPRNPDRTVEIRDDLRPVVDELIQLGLIESRNREEPGSYKLQTRLNPNVRAFRIALTEQCNLRCAECFVTKNQDRLRTMSQETLEKVIRDTLPYGKAKGVKYHFFGGEPLLKFDHIERAVAILEEALLRGEIQAPLYTITTNLTLLDDRIIAFFKKHGFKVGVSIDGPQEINDKLRVYTNGTGSFADVERNYDRLVAAGIDAHVLITPHHLFLDKLPDIVRFVLGRFSMKTLTINTPLHFETLAWIVPGEAYARVLLEVARMAKQSGVTIDSAASPPLAALAGQVRREGPCAVYCDNIMTSVSTDGRMSFCSQKWHPELSVPSVSSTAALQIPIRRTIECAECEAKHICGGPCPAHQAIVRRTMDDNKCSFMRSLLRGVVENLDLFEET